MLVYALRGFTTESTSGELRANAEAPASGVIRLCLEGAKGLRCTTLRDPPCAFDRKSKFRGGCDPAAGELLGLWRDMRGGSMLLCSKEGLYNPMEAL
jgi:hypothetical protein